MEEVMCNERKLWAEYVEERQHTEGYIAFVHPKSLVKGKVQETSGAAVMLGHVNEKHSALCQVYASL